MTTINLLTNTKLHTKTPPYTIIKNSHQILIIHLFTTTSLYNHTYILHSIKKNFSISFIKPQKRFITPTIIMSSCWKPSVSTPLSLWDESPSNRWEYWKPEHPCAPGRQLILPKRPGGTLVNDRHTKMVKIVKNILFDTTLM